MTNTLLLAFYAVQVSMFRACDRVALLPGNAGANLGRYGEPAERTQLMLSLQDSQAAELTLCFLQGSHSQRFTGFRFPGTLARSLCNWTKNGFPFHAQSNMNEKTGKSDRALNIVISQHIKHVQEYVKQYRCFTVGNDVLNRICGWPQGESLSEPGTLFDSNQDVFELAGNHHIVGWTFSRYHVLRNFVIAQLIVMNHLCVGKAENVYLYTWCLVSESLGLERPQTWIPKTFRSIPCKHVSTFTFACRRIRRVVKKIESFLLFNQCESYSKGNYNPFCVAQIVIASLSMLLQL